MLKEILVYQEKDGQLENIKAELERSESKKVVNASVAQVKNARNRMCDLEKLADKVIAEYEVLKKKYEQDENKLNEFKNQNLEKMSESDLREHALILNKQIGRVLTLAKEIGKMSKQIATIIADFEKSKVDGINARKKYDDAIKKYNTFAETKNKEIESIKNEMKSLSKNIDTKTLEYYNKMRADNIFPVFEKLKNGNSCGGCSMELSKARLDLLQKQNVLECENCHIMIYMDKDKD